MKYSDDLETIGGRIAYLFNKTDKYKLTENNLYSAIREMYNLGILEYTEIAKEKNEAAANYDKRVSDRHKTDITNSYNQITRHLLNKVIPSTQWILKYSKFFKCSTDYILGCIDTPQKLTSGLTTNAINNLLSDKEKGLVTNSLLETNAIDYIIQALHFYTKYVHANNYIFNQLDNNIPGITQTDLDVFYSNLKAGNQSQKDAMACVCFDNILRDKALKEYLENYAFDNFSEKLSADISKQINAPINQK